MSRIRLRTGRGTKWLTLLLGIALVFGWPSRWAEEANAPQVQIYFPAPKAEVSGVIQVRVRAFSPYGIHFIEVYLDDLPRSFGVRNTEPFTFNLSTTRFTEGIHTVRALLVDFKGVEQWSDPVEIEIRNSPKPIEAPNPIVPRAGAQGVIAPPGALPLPVAGAEGAALPGNAALGRVTLTADALRPRSSVAVESAAPAASVFESLMPRAAGVVSAAPLGVPSGRVASEPVVPASVRAMSRAAGTAGGSGQRISESVARPAQSVPAVGAARPQARPVTEPRAALRSAPQAVTAVPSGAPRTSASPLPAQWTKVPSAPAILAPAAPTSPARTVTAQPPPHAAAVEPPAAPRAAGAAAPAATPAEPVRIASLSPMPALARHEPRPPAFERTGVLFNGRPLSTDVAFHLVGGLALAPLRAVAEASGAVVMWVPTQRHAAIYLRGHRILIVADSDAAVVDGSTAHLAMAPRIVSDRMLVPARFLADILEMRVGYDAATRQLRFRPR